MNIASTIRLTEIGPTRLKCTTRPPIWLLAIVSALLLGVGLLMALTPTVECSWAADGSLNCRITRSLLGITIASRMVSGVDVIGFGRLHMDETGTGVIIRKGNTWIDVGGGDVSKKQAKAAEALNQFLREHRQGATWSISLPCPGPAWGFYLLFIAALGLAFRPTQLCADAELNRLEVVRPGVGKSRRRTLLLSDIGSFALTQRYVESAEDPPGWAKKYLPNLLKVPEQTNEETALVLVARLKNGKEVALLTNLCGGQPAMGLVRGLERVRCALLAPAPGGIRKPCAICGAECDGAPRLQDENGAYYHPACHQARASARSA